MCGDWLACGLPMGMRAYLVLSICIVNKEWWYVGGSRRCIRTLSWTTAVYGSNTG